MKSNYPSFITFTFIGILSFSSKPNSAQTSVWQTFYLRSDVSYPNPYNPLHYTTTPSFCEVGNATICSLDVLSSSEIYTLTQSFLKSGSTAYWGLPKVDISTQQIKLDIDLALDDPANSYMFPSGRYIVERP